MGRRALRRAARFRSRRGATSLRARFLADHGWGDEAAILAELDRRDELLARARAVLLWFEHDLFDQLRLLQVLSQVEDDTEVELIQADNYLGPCDADRLEALRDEGRPVDAAGRALARDTWRDATGSLVLPRPGRSRCRRRAATTAPSSRRPSS